MSYFEEDFEKVRRWDEERRRKRRKDEDAFEIVEEVFDRPTLMALYDLINDGIIDRMFGVVATGKEARVYWAKNSRGDDLAVKIFLKETSDFRRSIIKYIDGDPRFARMRRDIRHIIKIWCSKEFKNLKEAFAAGVRVPEPIAFRENILVMKFIGDDGVPAPLIREVPPGDPEEAFGTVLEYIKRAVLKAKIVHADLSEYNIMNWNEELYIIDWGSAVHITHPQALEFLRRDISNIVNFFRKLGIETPSVEDIYKRLIREIP